MNVQPPRDAAPTAPSERSTILVVDDEKRNRALVHAWLTPTYDVQEAADAAAAFEVLARSDIDLVLMDVMMPLMSGLEACRIIKQSRGDRYLPVILLTALDEQGERNAGLAAGADDFLTKPVDRHELLLRLRTFTRLKRQDECIRNQVKALTEQDALIRRQLAELQELAAARMQAADELRLTNEELEAFSYSVSHDLQAPLRSIRAFSNILLTEHVERIDDEGRSHLARIQAAATRMASLTGSLLELARVSRGEVRRKTVDLTELGRKTIDELRRQSAARRVEVVLDQDLRAQADPQLVPIVLDNLLGNAWKFTRHRVEAHISLGRVLVDDEVAFFVRDDGAGFDPALAGRLFQPFQRLHAASEFDGTGIGLATVRRIVSRHGGRIWIEAAVDQGATFFFTLERPICR